MPKIIYKTNMKENLTVITPPPTHTDDYICSQ